MSRPDKEESLTYEDVAEKQSQFDDAYCIPLESLPEKDVTKKPETGGVVDAKNKGQEENKDHVYAVVHKGNKGTSYSASFHARTRCSLREAISLEPVNRSSSLDSGNRPSSATGRGMNIDKVAADQEALSGNEKKDYLYATVDTANKKKITPQMPSPYHGLVYADLNHSPANNTRPVKRKFPTIYADIDYLKTDTANSKPPEENLDQTTECDGP